MGSLFMRLVINIMIKVELVDCSSHGTGILSSIIVDFSLGSYKKGVKSVSFS